MTVTKMAVGLPVANPTKSYWQTPPSHLADHRSTAELPSSAQYVIVGSGITGALTAYKLLEENPSASILILEARQTCSGATGRNGGHCRPGRYLSFADDVEKFGKEDALRMEALEETSVKNVGKLVKKLNIDCDFREVETLDITTDEAKWKRWLAALKARKEVFQGRLEEEVLTKHKVWTSKEAREVLLIPDAVGAISFPAFALSPYKFVCRLLEQCLSKGINLQTNTPVTEISRPVSQASSNEWIVHTMRGAIRTKNVILATNAYTSALYAPLGDFINPTRGQLLAIRPGSKIAGNSVLERTMGLENHISGDYLQSRAEKFSGAGDLLVGGGRRLAPGGEHQTLDDSTIHPKISSYLHQVPTIYFGKENWGEAGATVQEWTGIMAYTPDEQPVIGEAPGQKGLWIAAGFNGHGMALTFQSAEALVQLIMGNDKGVSEWLPECYKLSRVKNNGQGRGYVI